MKIHERFFVNVKVSAANSAVAHLDFYLIAVTARIFDLPQFGVTDSRFIFNQGLHEGI
ncbi:MAG: hypothetical protein ACR2G5_05805 [Pyrinomonadaceae bacterium]